MMRDIQEGTASEMAMRYMRRRIKELEQALEPFAKAADRGGTVWPDDMPLAQNSSATMGLTIGDCRRARAVFMEGR